MMTSPAFWRHGSTSILPKLLSPLQLVTRQITAARLRQPGFAASVPVICCGNVTVGGSGKTILALAILAEFARLKMPAAALTRGHGGNWPKHIVHRVDLTRDSVSQTGDEARLLAAVAPTYICADRGKAARAAIAAGARALVMDDGLQNPSLQKDLSFLVIDGPEGFGNGCLLPAGPLREPVANAAARVQAAIMIGTDVTGAAAFLPSNLPLLQASLAPDAALAALREQKLYGFAGIGRPEKFFAMLIKHHGDVAGCRAFPDHHVYTKNDFWLLQQEAARLGAKLVCTAKDAVKLPKNFPAQSIGVDLVFADKTAFGALIAAAMHAKISVA
jgi:tetraacyldisaccharide 4'-kinase